jgi:predicted TIM-barrel fold metal-dependent hydrolase
MTVYQDETKVSEGAPKKHDRFFNCHAHCFTMDHVPDYFFAKLMPVTKLLRKRWVKNLVKNGPVTGKMPFFLRILIFFLGLINLLNKKQLLRLVTMVRFGNTDEQKKVIESMRQYYPEATGIVFLTMDMEYMGAGKPVKKLEQQFEELATLKKSEEYQNVIYPFAFIDPRRIEPRGEEIKIEKQFIGDVFLQKVETYIKEGSFQGLKIYPALGYYPFDERMKLAYDLAIKYNLPITTHCTIGAVHHKHKIESSKRVHPFKGPLPDLRPVDYQKFFSHPLNYLCLMDQQLLKQVWGQDAPDYRNLKMCIGHWGAEDDWHRYLEKDWADVYERTKDDHCPALLLKNWHTDKHDAYLNFTWFTVIYELLRNKKFPNLYTDISYTLHDASLLPMLKMMLESNEDVRNHVLFGTDFYMVSKTISERSYSINLRAALGQDLFEQIAIVNARKFLKNMINQPQ